ncbi:alpha/beta hydrolase [Streptomyces sp. NBC_01136]|uniref:alpha/beta fold hydrolase n=1 Tax=unclassified Streptomyces TaxID=2593676 RepID=UPI0032478339|nr:alpha/beta hydrolase [Streptomyces sp. NBC_01136]
MAGAENTGGGTRLGPEALAPLLTVLDLAQPLLAAADTTLRVFPADEAEAAALDARAVDRCNEVLAHLGAAHDLTVPRFVAPAPDAPSSLEVALSNLCDLELGSWRPLADSAGELPEPGTGGAVGSAGSVGPVRSGSAALPGRHRVTVPGLPPFESFAAGDPGDEAIVLVPPCGVPAGLFAPWLDRLSARHRVITYENPYLFGDWASLSTPSGDFAEEIAQVAAVAGEYGPGRVHLIGVCGGAPVALAAAALLGDQVGSLTMLHPDLNFGPGVTRTPFQTQFHGLLAGAGRSPSRAREVLSMFLDPNMLFGVPPRLAPFVLYPYGDIELFHRYARLNDALMAYDAGEAAREAGSRTLIVTSRTDRMTHPDTARHLHELVPGSRLEERAAGSHHDILVPDDEMFTLIQAFIDDATHASGPAPAPALAAGSPP